MNEIALRRREVDEKLKQVGGKNRQDSIKCCSISRSLSGVIGRL